MAIRGPQGPKAEVVAQQQGPRSPAAGPPASPIQRLLDFGAARTPQEARKLVAELLATLRAAGFPVSAAGSAEGQLGAALKLFQESRGLPANGRLDEQTRDALVDAGHLPHDPNEGIDTRSAPGKAAPREVDLRPRADPRLGVGELSMRAPSGSEGRPEGTKSTQGVELQQLADRAAREQLPEVSLKSFLASMRAAGFAGSGAGATQLKDALKKLQKAEALPQSGQLDARTAAALVKRGIVDERVLPLTMASAQEAARPAETKDTRAEAKDAQRDASTRGAAEDGGASKGRGDVSSDGQGPAAGTGGQGDARNAAAAVRIGAAGADPGAQGNGDIDDPWRAGEDGNAPAGGDDIDDERRGHANVDDGLEGREGHWEVPALSEQIAAGLAAIVRDDDGVGAATYAWDFALHRPGVYGAKQPAEKLFRLVVTRASAFDALWEQARAALNDKLALLEPDAALVQAEDVARSLRVARMKDRL